jgi:hypothetical protein
MTLPTLTLLRLSNVLSLKTYSLRKNNVSATSPLTFLMLQHLHLNPLSSLNEKENGIIIPVYIT